MIPNPRNLSESETLAANGNLQFSVKIRQNGQSPRKSGPWPFTTMPDILRGFIHDFPQACITVINVEEAKPPHTPIANSIQQAAE